MDRKNSGGKSKGKCAAYGFAYALTLIILASGCSDCGVAGTAEPVSGKDNSIAIMTWNVQTLFDGYEGGTEYDDFLESAGWNREKYKGRLNVIASAVSSMERKPDIIAMQEIESVNVLKDLSDAISRQPGTPAYSWIHFAIIPDMALGVGILSSFPLESARSHSVYANGDLTPRPMLEARINVAGKGAANKPAEAGSDPLMLFICHWKSKLGGDDVTESTRRASARVILRRLRELAESEPDLPVIIMGDLNENHDEFYRRSGTVISALLPDDPRAAEIAGLHGLDAAAGDLQKDFIVISKNKPPAARFFPPDSVVLYSPWNAELENGSYYYRNNWETIDHFLLSPQLFSGGKWNFSACKVVITPSFANANGLPVAYNPRTGYGLSDHLPLLLILKK